ncbi:hypothetical protein SAMCCGM7_pA0167 (plasmid) [Sinorhizobium americanum CCGM7]|nr:hypothetical protein SAMCCGM7_pA0167 [Sinorhizobium americanum CCGM7]
MMMRHKAVDNDCAGCTGAELGNSAPARSMIVSPRGYRTALSVIEPHLVMKILSSVGRVYGTV